MSPRWLTIEKLVTELGGVCSAGEEAKGGAFAPREMADIDDSLREATRAVTAAIADPASSLGNINEQDEVVRVAWAAIAVAQDRIAILSEVLARSRALRHRAQGLQDHSLRLRLRRDRRPPG
jgi:hypothetical protein